MNILVIDFSPTNFIPESLGKKHQVFTEKQDGERTYRTIGEIIPYLLRRRF